MSWPFDNGDDNGQVNRQDNGIIEGDMNCVISKLDCTHHFSAKMSPSLQNLIKTFEMKDSFRNLYPESKSFSHFYESAQLGKGATRIDRSYHWGNVNICEAWYEPVAFSDHMAHVIICSLPMSFSRILSPRAKSNFKIQDPGYLDIWFSMKI